MRRLERPYVSSSSIRFSDDLARRKRLGQYFTGEKLAHLLVTLANPTQIRSAIDPMCGSGDMLSIVRNVYPSASLAGIEVDGDAYELCVAQLANFDGQISLSNGNAFSWSVLSKLPATSFDLVVTNPPYVRYQSYASNDDIKSLGLPNAKSVRNGLMQIAQQIDHLEEKDREIFLSIIRAYSGLSDLAVPSWILCMMLTAVGGRLALVVPEAWLKRDYSYPIHYLLLKLFRILFVVEDANGVWFEGAQIRTTLLVAERIPRTDNLLTDFNPQGYVHASVVASAMNENSMVGNLFPAETDPDAIFTRMMSDIYHGRDTNLPTGVKAVRTTLSRKLFDLVGDASRSNWLRECEPKFNHATVKSLINKSNRVSIPEALIDILPLNKTQAFTTLESLGGQVGQGLRTGANNFFYCELISELGGDSLISPGKALNLQPFKSPSRALHVVLRKQSEIPEGYVIDPSLLAGRALVLETFIHPNDQTKLIGGLELSGRSLMPSSVASFITKVETINIGTEDEPRFIPQLTAVRTNETRNKTAPQARFWYMLPPFAKRHLPDLFVPRVNYHHPKTILNSKEPVLIDANFSTIWLEKEASIDVFALLACLNSGWILAAMELSASVMGGGALKLEATHIRRLPLPRLSPEQWGQLSSLGRMLVNGDNPDTQTINEINQKIASFLFGEQAAIGLERIENIKNGSLEARRYKK